MEAAAAPRVGDSTPVRRPAWGRSIIAGVAAVTIGPLVAIAFGLVVRALLVPAPVSNAGPVDVFGAWPRAGLWPVLGVLLLFGIWLVDAAVRQRVFGTIADADVTLWACVVSALITPGAWLLNGNRSVLVFSLVVGPVFLRWRSSAPGVAIWHGGTRAGLVRWRVLLLVGAAIAGGVAFVVVARAPVLNVPALGGSLSWGPRTGVPLSTAQYAQGVAPLSSYSGKTAPRVLTYRMPLENNGGLPIVITGLAAHVSGHILRLRAVAVADSHLSVGEQTTVAVRMSLGTCASPRGPSVSAVTAITVSYDVARGLIHRSEVIKPAGGVQLLCPSSSTPPTEALLLNVG